MSEDILEDIRTHGVDVDVVPEANVIGSDKFLRLEVDVEKERKKGKDSDMWDDHTDEEYLKLFKKNELITDELQPKLDQLLLDFKQIFYNPEKPQNFTGLKMNPINVEALPGTVPKKDRLRRASDTKAPYILEHL